MENNLTFWRCWFDKCLLWTEKMCIFLLVYLLKWKRAFNFFFFDYFFVIFSKHVLWGIPVLGSLSNFQSPFSTKINWEDFIWELAARTHWVWCKGLFFCALWACLRWLVVAAWLPVKCALLSCKLKEISRLIVDVHTPFDSFHVLLILGFGCCLSQLLILRFSSLGDIVMFNHTCWLWQWSFRKPFHVSNILGIHDLGWPLYVSELRHQLPLQIIIMALIIFSHHLLCGQSCCNWVFAFKPNSLARRGMRLLPSWSCR